MLAVDLFLLSIWLGMVRVFLCQCIIFIEGKRGPPYQGEDLYTLKIISPPLAFKREVLALKMIASSAFRGD